MGSKRRSELEIIGEILALSKQGAKKTEILYQNNMSFSQLQNYLSYLSENDLIRENISLTTHGSVHKVFTTTDKGNNLLSDIHKIRTYFE